MTELARRDGGRIRTLFVFAWLGGGAETEARLLARHLDPARHRIDAVACFHQTGAAEAAVARLATAGVDVDTTPYGLSFEETVDYLARRIAAYDIIISCQDVADIYPALERLRWRPPLIEHGRSVSEALAGPKHFTNRYVGTHRSVRDAAAGRMPGREARAVEIPAMMDRGDPRPEVHAPERALAGGGASFWAPEGAAEREARDPDILALVARWESLLREVLEERVPAAPPSVFASVLQGGFECSTHRRGDGRRLDVIRATGHDIHAAADYRQLREHGIATVRDGLRWHLIERAPGRYDWSSFLPMLRAARAAGTQVIWDLLHYGWPEDIDIWSPAFVDRFANFADAVARVVRSETDATAFYCPVNEISFFSWAAGDVAYLNPFARGRGFELKAQMARASIAAMHRILARDPDARFVHCEPAIHVACDPARPEQRAAAEGWHQAQYQAWDLIAGRIWPQLGGEPRLLDLVGVNYYFDNQWIHAGPPIDMGHPLYRPVRNILAEVHARYGRPVVVSETGIEGDRRAAWMRYMAGEVSAARAAGVPVEGLCLYPIVDHVGWDDDRICPSGLLSTAIWNGRRHVHEPLAREARLWLASEGRTGLPRSGSIRARDR